MTDNTNTVTSIHLTDDELFILAAILHQINRNMKAAEGGVFRSHADFQFAGDRGDAVYGGYNIFRSLTGKVYDMNLRKAVKSMEGWL